MFFDSRNLDSFDQYLQDVERYPLIADPKEEREIARKARVGNRAAAERLADFARSDMEPAGAPIPDSWIEFLSDRLPYRTQADRDHLHDSLRQAGLS